MSNSRVFHIQFAICIVGAHPQVKVSVFSLERYDEVGTENVLTPSGDTIGSSVSCTEAYMNFTC